MRAAVFDSPGTVKITTKPDPTLQAVDDIIIEVRACGICGADLDALTTPPKIVANPGVAIGHEFAGIVVDAGSDASVSVGTNVAVQPNISCGGCWYCRSGASNLCSELIHLGFAADGGAAEYCRVPAHYAHPVATDVPFEVAALAEPLACVLNGTRKAGVHAGYSAAILGGGPIGALFLLVLKACGAEPVIVSEPAEYRRKMMTSLGADIVVEPLSESISNVVLDATPVGVDLVVDAVGGRLPESLDLVRRGGRILLFGIERGQSAMEQSAIVLKEVSVSGVFLGHNTFPLAARLLEIDPGRYGAIISHRFPLEDFDQAIRTTRSGNALKTSIDLRGLHCP